MIGTLFGFVAVAAVSYIAGHYKILARFISKRSQG